MGNKSSKISKRRQTKESKTITKRAIASKLQNNRVLPAADWLLVGGDFTIELFEKCYIDQLEELYRSNRKGNVDDTIKQYDVFVPLYAELNDPKIVFIDEDYRRIKGMYPYYRKIAAYAAQNPAIAAISSDTYFIFAQYYRDTISNEIITESLRLSLLSNLSKLAKDKSIKYDLRDAATGKYLYHKIKRFGVKEEDTINIVDKPWKNMKKLDYIRNDYDVEAQYDMKYDCMTYKFMHDSKKNDANTTFIHDLIDPNKYLFESKLWIPAIFDCTKDIKDKNVNVMDIIKSPILGLDYIKYKALYEDIAKIFKIVIQPMFENILNYKLGEDEKIIVKSMKYILQKPGDYYQGNIHREGMGENIICIAIYYPQITSKKKGMMNGTLKVSIPDVANQFLKCGGQEFEIQEGSCIAFSNQGFHQVPEINFSSNNKNELSPITRTILAFFIINRYHSDEKNGCNVNLAFYWIYYISYWLRIYGFHNTDNQWLIQLIYKYLFEEQFEDYLYYKRHEQRQEKGQPLIETVDESTNWSGEEMFYVEPDLFYDS